MPSPNEATMPGPTRLRRGVEARDLEQILSAFAEDAVLHSPITFQPFEGRAAIGRLLAILLQVFRDFHYTDELASADGRTAALIFRARVGDRDAEGLDLVRFDERGLIRDLTVMVRPRSAIEALLAEVGPRLAAAAGS
jgi:hypothetical protein